MSNDAQDKSRRKALVQLTAVAGGVVGEGRNA